MEPEHNRPVEIIDESLPLLEVVSIHKIVRKKPSPWRYIYVISIAAWFIIMGLLTVNFIQNVSSCVDKSLEVKLDKVSIEGLSFGGVIIRVQALVEVNYDNIPNWLHRNIFKISGFTVGSLTVIASDAMKVLAKPSALEISPLHVADVFPPPIAVDIFNNASNMIDFTAETSLISLNVIKFMDYIDSAPENDVLLDVTGVFTGIVQSKFANVSITDVSFQKQVTFSKEKYLPQFSIDSTEIRANDKQELEVSSKITLHNKLPLNFQLDQVEWKVLLPDCNGFSSVGSWYSSPTAIIPGKSTQIEVIGIIDSIPETLLTKCKFTSTTPMNQIIEQLVLQNEIELTLKALSSAYLPHWLKEILQIRITIPLESFKNITKNMGATNFDKCNINIPSNSADVDVNMSFTNINDIGMDFSYESDCTNITIYYGNESIFTGMLDKHSIDNGKRMLKVDLNRLQGKLESPEIIGKLINGYLNKFQDIELTFVLGIQNLTINSPINLVIELEKLNLERVITITQEHKSIILLLLNMIGTNELKRINQIPLDSTITSMKYISSTENYVEIEVDALIDNASNDYSLSFLDEVSFEVASNSSKMARMNTKHIDIKQHENSTIGAKVSFGPLEPAELIEFELLASKLISGVNCSIDVSNISTTNVDFNELIGQVNVNGISIQQNNNKYLLSSTIHLFTSTVELVLFNPIENHELEIDIYQSTAKYGDIILGQLVTPQRLVVPPGVYHSAKLPFKINSSIAMDILRKAMNKDLQVDLISVFKVTLDNFHAELYYNGHDLRTNIEW